MSVRRQCSGAILWLGVWLGGIGLGLPGLFGAEPPVPALPVPALPEIALPSSATGATGPTAAPALIPAADAARLTDLFRPHRTEMATLSPDGLHVAYSVRDGENLSVIVAATDRLDVATARLVVVDDRSATPQFSPFDEKVPARINWMKWVGNDRLVVETNAQTATGTDTSVPGAIVTFKADGSDRAIAVTPRDVVEFVSTAARQRVTIATRADRNTPLVATPDQVAVAEEDVTAGNELFATDGEPASFFPADTTLVDPNATGASAYPSPTVVDLVGHDPSKVLVRTFSDVYLTLFELDPAKRRLRELASYTVDPGEKLLVDRQGMPRISAPARSSVPFPHRLRLDRGPGARRRQDLSTAAGFAEGAGFVVSPDNFFRERAIPLGFDENPEVLWYASNVGRDTYGIYSVNLTTGRRTGTAIENPELDLIGVSTDAFGPPETLVYDRHTRKVAGVRVIGRTRSTRWFAPEFQAVQALLEKSLPGQNVDILEWNVDGTRFLAATSGPTGPGGFVLFDGKTLQLQEFARRAPWLQGVQPNRTVSFTVEVQPGVELECRLTFSPHARVKAQPLIVICPSAPWERLPLDFQPEVQALAAMGFAVAQPASRGAWGYGMKRRDSIHQGYDRAQVGDVVRIVEEIAKVFTIDTQRVGLVGAGHGAFVALRAMELHPERFRCAVALNPIVNLGKWLDEERVSSADVTPQLFRTYYGPRELLAQNALVRDAKQIVKPVFILSYPGPHGGQRRPTYVSARAFAGTVRRPGVEVAFADLSPEFNQGLPGAKTAVFQQIEDFLNANVYDFATKIGEIKALPGEPLRQ